MKEWINKNLKYITIVLGVVIILFSIRIYQLNFYLREATFKLPVLKDCPMCGKEVELEPIGNRFHIECDSFDGGCGLKSGYYHSQIDLVERWNDIDNE